MWGSGRLWGVDATRYELSRSALSNREGNNKGALREMKEDVDEDVDVAEDVNVAVAVAVDVAVDVTVERERDLCLRACLEN